MIGIFGAADLLSFYNILSTFPLEYQCIWRLYILRMCASSPRQVKATTYQFLKKRLDPLRFKNMLK